MRLVSVIIPSYNSEATIYQCIKSILNTGFQDLEILIVDDSSTDSSPIIAESLCRQNNNILKLIRQPKNSGPAKARNTGASAAKGQYLFFLDSDTEMLPDTLQNFVNRIEDCDAAVGVYAAEPINNGIVPLYKALFNNYFFSRAGVIDYEVFDSSRAGIKADVFQDIGGFDESLGWGMDYENEELGYRLCKEYRVQLDPSIKVKHVFPEWKQLTKTYFSRVALWLAIFMKRKKFESGGVTSAGTGISSASLLLSLILIFVGLLIPSGILSLVILGIGGAAFLLYLFGYYGFFWFVLYKKPYFFPAAFCLNIFFTLVIALGAGFGALRTIAGQSEIKL